MKEKMLTKLERDRAVGQVNYLPFYFLCSDTCTLANESGFDMAVVEIVS